MTSMTSWIRTCNPGQPSDTMIGSISTMLTMPADVDRKRSLHSYSIAACSEGMQTYSVGSRIATAKTVNLHS
jgi:hypothetical protein